jgi:hypothetical protein
MNCKSFPQIRLSIIFMLILLMLSWLPIKIVAADYDRSFIEVFGLGGSDVDGRSPMRNSSNDDIWTNCGSKNNQPRVANGTNPHQGSDLQMPEGTKVYPAYAGTIDSIRTDTSQQLGRVIIRSTDSDIGTFYIEYLHIVPSSTLTVGQSVTVNTQIGTIDSYKVYYPHLHFGRVNSTSTYNYKLYSFYRWISEWNYGSDLDFLSGDVVSSGNNFYITGYTRSGASAYDLQSLRLYYKVGSAGTWTGPVDFTMSTPSIHRYVINLRTATGASPGQTIYYYVAGIRANDPDFNATYRHGLYPQYYTHPALPLSSSYANTIAQSYTIVP